jgi:hypothetical protein
VAGLNTVQAGILMVGKAPGEAWVAAAHAAVGLGDLTAKRQAVRHAP